MLLGGSLEGVGFGAGCSCDLSLGLVGETCCWRMVTGGSSLACFLGDSTPFPGGTLEVPCGDAPDRCRPLFPEVPGMLEECHEGVLGRAGCTVGRRNEHVFIWRSMQAPQLVVGVKDETGRFRCRPAEVRCAWLRQVPFLGSSLALTLFLRKLRDTASFS